MKVYTNSGRESAQILEIREHPSSHLYKKQSITYSPGDRFNRFRLNERIELGTVTNEQRMPETYTSVHTSMEQ